LGKGAQRGQKKTEPASNQTGCVADGLKTSWQIYQRLEHFKKTTRSWARSTVSTGWKK
jgi:hypothetical protein